MIHTQTHIAGQKPEVFTPRLSFLSFPPESGGSVGSNRIGREDNYKPCWHLIASGILPHAIYLHAVGTDAVSKLIKERKFAAIQ